MTTKKYSLRKVKVGVASVLVGFGIATTGAVVAHAQDTAPAPASDKAKEEAAQKDFLANFDKALADSVAALEKGEATSPEEVKAKADTIAKLKEVAAANKAEIEEAFKVFGQAADHHAIKVIIENDLSPAQ